jgi:hypothetical protein
MGPNDDEPPELPILPYPDRRAGQSSGWSGSDTSRDRAEHDDSTGVTTERQRMVLTMLEDARVRGLTWKELADQAGWHHGQASGALSVLHQVGLIERLAERRNRCHPYVLPIWVLGRETQQFKVRKGPTLHQAWGQGWDARDRGVERELNPYDND